VPEARGMTQAEIKPGKPVAGNRITNKKSKVRSCPTPFPDERVSDPGREHAKAGAGTYVFEPRLSEYSGNL